MTATEPRPDFPDGFLSWVFRLADNRGYGIASGESFEPFPGMEAAAVAWIENFIDSLFKED